MIAKILPLICALALVGAVNDDPSQAAAICAAPGSNSVLVAHEDCSKFYKCWQGIPVPINCPKPLLYNPEKEWCDWDENVNCNRKVNEEEQQGRDIRSSGIHFNVDNIRDAAKICAAEGSDGVLVPHEVCNKFYACTSGKPYEFECAYPLVYSIELQRCDWRRNVDCGDRT